MVSAQISPTRRQSHHRPALSFRVAGDDKIIRVTDESQGRNLSPIGLRRVLGGYFLFSSRSKPSSAQLASAGEIIPP